MKRFIINLIAVVVLSMSVWAQSEAVLSIQYWIDDNHPSATISSAMEFDIDCQALSPGMHLLHYRIKDSENSYSPLYEHSFYKLPTILSATKIESIQYWWDDMYTNAVSMPYTGESFTLSTDALPYGLHSLKFRVRDDSGRWSECRSHYFYKSQSQASANIVSYSYWWNDLTDKTVTKTLNEPAPSIVIDENFTVPDEAKTNYAGHYTETLNILVTDSRGHSTYLCSNVTYPDNDAPVTDIDADKYVATTTVTLTWEDKSGDEISDYNVYVSKDGGPFLLWLPDTKLTTAKFAGEKGSNYIFTVTGRDKFGNRENYDESKCVSVTFD